MKSIILLIFTIISITATAQEIEVKILNDIFVELIGEEHYLKPIAPPPPPIPSDSIIKINPTFWTKEKNKEFTELSIKYDSIVRNREVDNRQLLVFIREKLENNTAELKGNWKNIIEFDSSFTKLDFINFLEYKSQNIDLVKLKNVGRFELHRYSDSKLFSTTDRMKTIGQVILSRIYMNHQKNKGFFFYNFLFDPNHSDISVVFIEERNGKWVILKKEGIRIS